MPLPIAWAAGLFEGEGSIDGHPRKDRGGRVYPSLGLEMTCRDVVERFAETVGCGTIRPRAPRQEGWKRSYRWEVSAAPRVARLLDEFLPYLGAKKTGEAEAALAACKQIGPPMRERTHCAQGHELTPENTGYMVCGGYRQRRCLQCKRIT